MFRSNASGGRSRSLALGPFCSTRVRTHRPARLYASALSFDWGSGLNVVHRNGDVVLINARVGNDQIPSGVCHVTDATVRLTFPHADGTPDGREFILATGVDFPPNAPKKSFGKRNLTVDFDPGVFRGFVFIYVSGIVHASDPDPVFGPISGAGRSVVISRPHVTLTVDPQISAGPPFTVTYTYTTENDSPSDPAGELSNPTPDTGRHIAEGHRQRLFPGDVHRGRHSDLGPADHRQRRDLDV
jgi:hypothetical protein